MDAAWIFVVIAAVVVLVALMVYVLPPRRDTASAAVDVPPGTTPSSSGSLARGFSYLQGSSGRTVRRGGVHSRLERAFQRIDAVDPHANTRRIGEALVQAGLADAAAPPAAPRRSAPATPVPPSTPSTQPSVLWVDPPAEQPRDLR